MTLDYAITTSAGTAYSYGNSDTLQAAIYSLRGIPDQPETAGGTVWIWGDITLDRRVDLIRGVCLDFLGHTVTLTPRAYSRRASFVYIGRTASYCTVRNAKIVASTTLVTPYILIESRGTTFPPIEGVLLEDLTFHNNHEPTPDGEGAPVGIMINAINGGIVQANTLQRLRFKNVSVGIFLNKHSSDRNGIQDNLFHDIHFVGFYSLVHFYFIDDYSGYSCNLFNHVRGDASTPTRLGFDNIAGEANHFDHCSIDHWESVPALADGSQAPDWVLNQDATLTYICAHSVFTMYDGGSTYTTIDPPLINNSTQNRPDQLSRSTLPVSGTRLVRGFLRPWEIPS